MPVTRSSCFAGSSRSRDARATLGPRAPPLRTPPAAHVSRPLRETAWHLSRNRTYSAARGAHQFARVPRFRLLSSAFARSGFCSGSFDQLTAAALRPPTATTSPTETTSSHLPPPPSRPTYSGRAPVFVALRRPPLPQPAASALASPSFAVEISSQLALCPLGDGRDALLASKCGDCVGGRSSSGLMKRLIACKGSGVAMSPARNILHTGAADDRIGSEDYANAEARAATSR